MDINDLRHADFRRIDLNLLVAFDALMVERHVGRAAARVCIGQPAMSHALQRLRVALEDPVFARSGNRMEPTALALELAPAVAAWLREANGFLFARQQFDVARADLTVRIAMIDSVEAVLLPPLMAALRQSAPGIRVLTKHLQRSEILPGLDTEEVDVAITPGDLPFREWHLNETISRTQFECVYSPTQIDMPAVISPAVLASFEHIALSWRGDAESEVDNYLAGLGLRRRIAVSAVSQLAIMRLLQGFPLVTMQSCMLTSIYRGVAGIAVRAIDAPGLELEVRQVWHRRNDKHPGHAYVRALMAEVLARESVRAGRRADGCPNS